MKRNTIKEPATVRISVRSRTDAADNIPFINSRGPFEDIALYDWQVEALQAMSFLEVVVLDAPATPMPVRHTAAIEAPPAQPAPTAEPVAAPMATPISEPVEVPMAEPVADALAEEPTALTVDELRAIREKASALKTLGDVNVMCIELGLESPKAGESLRTARAALLAALDAAIGE